LRTAYVALVQGNGIATARRLPTEAILGEAALSALFGEVQVDVVEALAIGKKGVSIGAMERRTKEPLKLEQSSCWRTSSIECAEPRDRADKQQKGTRRS
jgi:hypothetical protein